MSIATTLAVGLFLATSTLICTEWAASASSPYPSPDQAVLPSTDMHLLTGPQRLVQVEPGRRLNLVCAGSGEPTILFEDGTGGAAYDWRFVQASIAKQSTACAYDRVE